MKEMQLREDMLQKTGRDKVWMREGVAEGVTEEGCD